MILWIKKVTWTSTLHITPSSYQAYDMPHNTMFNSTILHEQCTIRLTNIEIFLVLLFFILFQIQMSWDFVRKHHDRSFLLKRTTNLSEWEWPTVLFSLFVRGFSSHSRICHSYGDLTIAGEGLQILTYARHSWPLSSEGSLACHTYWNMGHLFTMVIS